MSAWRRPLSASVAVAALLAGCSDSPESPTSASPSTTGPEATGTTTVPGGEGGVATTVVAGPGSTRGAPGATTPATTGAPPPHGGTPPTALPTGEVRIRGRVATVNGTARSFRLAEVVSGYSEVVTTTATTYTSSEGESETFAEIDAGAILSITGVPAGGNRLRATRIVSIA